VKELYPLAEVGDLAGAIWLPKDGQTNPIDVTQALARGARMGGAKIIQRTKVTALETRNGAVVAVETEKGRIACDKLALCGGLWSRDLARPAGVNIPLHACEHMYIVTDPIEGVTDTTPVLRDYDAYIYVKEDAGKLCIGGFEPEAKPWATHGVPEGHEYGVFPEDWEHFEVFMEGALERIPALETAGVRQFLNGAESFTPDSTYYLGETVEVKNLFVGTGFNSIGIASSGGAGMALAQWMVDGAMPMDLWSVDVRRVQPYQAALDFLSERATEMVGLMYAMHWPYQQHRTARNRRLSPFHEKLKAARACFGVAAGWERPLWFAPEGVAPEMAYSYGPQAWWPYAEAEAKACREAVALFDQTAFAKYRLEGPDACALLRKLCISDVDVEAGKAVYTQMLNAKGGIETDLTVTRLGPDSYFIVTSGATGRKDADWIRRNAEDAAFALIEETEDWAVLGVMGPKSRELLQGLSEADLSNAAFPFSACREIGIAGGPVRALRVSYMGELGWELYIPWARAAAVYDAVAAAGAPLGLVPAGALTMDALRLEKNFRHWGHDIGCEDTPLEAGMGFLVDWSKDFLGKAALEKQKTEGLHKRLVLFTIEQGAPLVLHEEPIYRNGEICGAVTSGNRALTLGKPVALGYVHREDGLADRDFILSGSYEIEIAGARFPAKPRLSALIDPKGERLRS
ncbi:MAG: FAD-dependent oxidoreductase, partial [Rhodovibrionaceae bacterium]